MQELELEEFDNNLPAQIRTPLGKHCSLQPCTVERHSERIRRSRLRVLLNGETWAELRVSIQKIREKYSRKQCPKSIMRANRQSPQHTQRSHEKRNARELILRKKPITSKRKPHTNNERGNKKRGDQRITLINRTIKGRGTISPIS